MQTIGNYHIVFPVQKWHLYDLNPLDMVWTYLKIAYRNLKKNKLVTFINLFGLGLSMSVCMMEMVIVQTELSYDKFHPRPDRTYRILTDYRQNSGNHWKLASTPLPLSPYLLADTANTEASVNVYPALKGTARIDGKELYLNGAFTQPSFFRVFGFSLSEGDPQTALTEPNTMILSQDAAIRFFGKGRALGQSLDIKGFGLYTITGILKKAPGKSHLDFDAYASAASIPSLERNKLLPARMDLWGDLMTGYTYVLVKQGAGISHLTGQLHAAAQQINREDKNGRTAFNIQSIGKVRPTSDDLYNDIGGGTTWAKLWVGIDISLLILIAACFNYTNLTIARALTRAKEVGVRKIAGAKRHQIFVQYLVESLVQAFLALGFAWLVLSMIIRYAPFNDGYEMVPSSWTYNSPYILCTIGFALFTGVLAGTAPAWILSAFKPLRVLKNLSTARIFGKVGIQKSLVVFQYSLSLVIIIFLATFFRQFTFLSHEDTGFKRDNVVVLSLGDMDAKLAGPRIAMVSGVGSVSALSTAFNPHFSGERSQGWVGAEKKDGLSVDYFYTDENFIPSMHIQLLAGRNFSHTPDSTGEREVILNAHAVKNLGFHSYDEALGKKLHVNDSLALDIVGIVNDIRYENAGKPINPMAFRHKESVCHYLFLNVDTQDKAALTQRLAASWASIAPKIPFSASWLDEDIKQNDSQRTTLSLLGYLAFIALGIATLGLLGLVIFTVETKRKETGIRKVMGASSRQIVELLSKRFIRLLIIAGAIAVPIGYVMGVLFLRNFTDRVGGIFLSALGCFLFLLGIGLLTIFSQTWRASLENPVNHLRTE